VVVVVVVGVVVVVVVILTGRRSNSRRQWWSDAKVCCVERVRCGDEVQRSEIRQTSDGYICILCISV